MPELPEVETMCRRIAPVVGCRICHIKRPKSTFHSISINPPLPNLCRRAKGQVIIAINRLGKRVILELENGDRIVIEPRMTGLVLLNNAPNRKHLRLIFELAGKSAPHKKGTGSKHSEVPLKKGTGSERSEAPLKKGTGSERSEAPLKKGTGSERSEVPVPFLQLASKRNETPGSFLRLLFWDQRGFGVVSLLSPRQFSLKLGPEQIGPDALHVTPAILKDRFGASRRAIKVALLDQQLLSGVGNLYASEILHRANVHPATPCNTLKPRHWSSIHAAMHEVLQEAIRHQGSTLRDGTYRASRDEPGNFQDKHRVYQRTGQPCLQCGKADIVRIVQAQRSTFFCPLCQR